MYLASLNRASLNAGNIVPSPGKLLGLPREETAESGQSATAKSPVFAGCEGNGIAVRSRKREFQGTAGHR